MKMNIKHYSKSTLSVVLALCMLLSCLTIGVVPTDAAKVDSEETGSSETYTVYFDNSFTGWSNVYAYSGSSMYSSGRVYKPGTAYQMTNIGDNIYSVTLTVNNGRVAFSNANMGGWDDFYGNTAVWTDEITSSYPKIVPDFDNTWSDNGTTYYFGEPFGDFTFYIWNEADWNTVKYYTFGGILAAGPWSGTAVTSSNLIGTINGHNVYRVELTSNDDHIILNDNGSTQTKDTVILENGHMYKTESNGTYNTAYSSDMLDTYELGYRVNGANASTNQTKSFSNGIADVTLTDGVTYQFWIKRKNNDSSNDAYFKDQNEGTMTRNNCSNWTFTAGNQADTKITTDGTGTYRFSFTQNGSNLSVSVTYPTLYNVSFTPSPTGGTVKVNNSSTSPVKVEKNKNFTIKATPSAGYTIDTVTSGSNTVTMSGDDTNGYTGTANVGTANKTVTVTFKKLDLTLTADAASNGSFTLSTASANPATTAQIGDTVTVTCSPDANYEVDTVTFNGTDATGSGNNWSFTMPGQNTTVIVTFKEKLYSINVATENTEKGTVKRGSDTVSGSTTQIGYVTAVTLDAVAKSGYDFDHWTVKRGTATKMIVNGTTVNLSGSSEQTFSGNTTASSSFRFNGTATLKAYYKFSIYDLGAKFTHNSDTSWNGNAVLTTDTSGSAKSGLSINEYFEVKITLADGYEVDGSPSFTTGTGYITPVQQPGYPTVNGNVVIYRYQATTAGNVEAKVTLKAAEPSLSNLKIRDRAHLNTALDSCVTYNSGDTAELYFLQPIVAKATTDSFSTLSFINGDETRSNIASGAEVQLTPDPNRTPETEDGYYSHTITVKAINAPAGVASREVSCTITVRVYFNNAQKDCFRLFKLFSKCVRETASTASTYYKPNAPINTYNTAYDAADSYIGNGYPDYDAADTDFANYNSFKTAYDLLMPFAKTSTVYILTKYQKSNSNPINVTFSSDDMNGDDWKHLRMYNAGRTISDNPESRHTDYYGKVSKNGDRYIYTVTYAGHGKMQVWRGTSANDAAVSSAKQLTGVIAQQSDFKDYYVNIYNTTAGSSATSTDISEYRDFGHNQTNTRKYLEIGQTQTGAQIKALLEIAPSGSMVTGSNPGITTTNTAFTITGPSGSASPQTYNLYNNAESFPASVQGMYTVSYTTKFGYDANGNEITKETSVSLWVAFDDVNIYVDMNGNVGNPILNFKYRVDSSGNPDASGSNYAYLPYEMDLVTGSESVYKYTIKISKLKDDYKLDFTGDNKIIIEYIIVENKYVTSGGIYDARPETGRFELNSTARITGEAWLKANSTNLTFFNIISYGSVTNHFLAVTEDGDFLLDSALNGVHGTGIITDEDEIYKAQYAANDGTSNTIHYKLDASAKAEAKFGDYTYSFDRWIVFKTPMNGLNTTTGNGLTEVTIPSGAEDYTTSRDIHLTSVPLYNNGEGDKTYVAVYKFVNFNSPVRVNVTYHFEDFDTTDGNYVFDENKGTKPATYTKHLTSNETNYDALLSSTTILQNMARDNAPRVESNYFHYSFSTERLPEINSDNCDSTFKVIAVDAYLKEEARDYTIIYNGTTYTGNYQQTKEFTTNVSNPVWKLKSYSFDGTATETVVCTDSTYRAKFVATGSADNGTNDCQVITVSSGSDSVANGKTVVTNSYTEVKNENDTTRLHHNFFIADFCEEGKLIGGGVLFATAVNGHYRYSSADNILNAPATREAFIRDILNGNYDIDYPAQSINNIGFRYKKFKSAEDVYRYSNDYSAYLTVFEGTNVNSVNYSGQKLRLFSFMVYDNNGTTTIVTSDGYAEVDRYLP